MSIAIESLQVTYLENSTREPYLLSQELLENGSAVEIEMILKRALSPESAESAILLFDLNPSIKACAKAYSITGELNSKFLVTEGPYLNMAERAANGLKISLFETSTYGQKIQRIRDGAEHLDHTHSHAARVERHIKAGVLLSPEITTTDRRAYYGLMLFPDNHDAIQLEAIERNEQAQENSPKINVKQGHGEAGAVRIRALTQLYSAENLTPLDQANIITGISAIQILFHERADQIHNAFQGTRNARDFSAECNELVALFHSDKEKFYTKLQNSQLIAAYKANELDPFTLSSQDISLFAIEARIVPDLTEEERQKGKKQEGKFLTDQTPFGLHPDFESEFGNILVENLHDNTPLFDFSSMTEEEVISFKTSVEISTHHAVISDVHDWVMPPDLANARTFTGSKSLKRPFITGSTKEIIRSIMCDGVEANYIEESDVRRKFFEFYTMDLHLEYSPLRESNYIQQLIYSCQLTAIDSFMEAGQVIMTGDEEHIRVYYTRIIHEEKAKMIKKLKRKGETVDHPILESLDAEIENIMNALKKTGKIRKYSEEEKDTFIEVGTAMREAVIERQRQKGVTPMEFTLPYSSYFSTSTNISKIKIIRQHNHQKAA